MVRWLAIVLGVSVSLLASVAQGANSGGTADVQSVSGLRTEDEIKKCDQALSNLKPGLLPAQAAGAAQSWLPIESKIWHRLCQRLKVLSADWPDLLASVEPSARSNNVHGAFIKAIVSSNQFDVPGFDYILIDGITVVDDLDLSNEILRSGLAVTHSSMQGEVRLDFFRSGHDINFSDTTFHKGLVGREMRVDGSIYLGAGRSGPIPASKLIDIASLSIPKSTITGEVQIHGVRAEGEFDFYDVSIGRTLEISDSTLYNVVYDLGHFRQIEMTNVTMNSETDNVSASSIHVDGAVFLDRSALHGDADFAGAVIGSDFSVRGAHLSSLDLTEARIGGQLVMGHATAPGSRLGVEPRWWNLESIRLDQANVGIISAPFDAWPTHRTLSGFAYSGFAPPPGISSNNYRLDVEQARTWVDLAAYSPSAYLALQRALSVAGLDEASRKIGIAGKNRERTEAWSDRRYGDWLWLTAQWMLIGYGYNTWIALIWIFALTAVGALVFISTSEAHAELMHYGIAYSFDMLLPIIKLREKHYEIDIREFAQRYYFYFHKIMGFILGSFIIAGLSGLTR